MSDKNTQQKDIKEIKIEGILTLKDPEMTLSEGHEYFTSTSYTYEGKTFVACTIGACRILFFICFITGLLILLIIVSIILYVFKLWPFS
jgi:hypothetical protein